MFSADQLARLDEGYFNIICTDGLDVTIQSQNTGHYWYLHSTGNAGESACIIFHILIISMGGQEACGRRLRA